MTHPQISVVSGGYHCLDGLTPSQGRNINESVIELFSHISYCPENSVQILFLADLDYSGPYRNVISMICFQVWISISSVQLLSHFWLFVTPWTAARQACLHYLHSLLKLMFIESVMPSYHLTLCRLLLLPSIFPNIRVFSNESALCIRWPKFWSISFSISSARLFFSSDLNDIQCATEPQLKP